jgi:hypothetical protein
MFMDMEGNNMYDSSEETRKHIRIVAEYIDGMSDQLTIRALLHDKSKLSGTEKEGFDKYTPRLKNTTYGSDKYKEYLKEMNGILQLHYAKNRHHPEHFEDGIKGMTLIDLVEMICDWKAATLRHKDGNILKSLDINQKRFGYSDELRRILFNTIMEYLN